MIKVIKERWNTEQCQKYWKKAKVAFIATISIETILLTTLFIMTKLGL